MLQMRLGGSRLKKLQQGAHKLRNRRALPNSGSHRCVRKRIPILTVGAPGQEEELGVRVTQLLDDMDDQAVEHLADGGDVAAQENGDGPVGVRRHGAQEPLAGGHRAVQLLGEDLHPLHDVELLLGVDEGLKKEGGGEPGRQHGDVVTTAAAASAPLLKLLLVRRHDEGGGQEADHLPHEVEIGVVEDAVVLDEVAVVLPDPLLQVR